MRAYANVCLYLLQHAHACFEEGGGAGRRTCWWTSRQVVDRARNETMKGMPKFFLVVYLAPRQWYAIRTPTVEPVSARNVSFPQTHERAHA